jgi:folate-binding protein YgfZ
VTTASPPVPGSAALGYTAARERAAVFDLPERGVLEATGPLRQKFLQGMLTNEVQALAAGQGNASALLDVKGHVQALLRVLVTGDAVLLETREDRSSLVQRTLEHYRVAAPVRFRVVPTTVVGLVGPRAEEVLRAGGAEVPEAPGSHLRTSFHGVEARVARAADLPPRGFAIHVAPEAAAALRGALADAGVPTVRREVIDALRVEALRPWCGEDVTEENLLHETGLVPECCSLSKGCYLGQEVVARLDARGGNVNKALRGLRLEREAPRGTPVLAAGKEVGRVTTAALSPKEGAIALAYVHRAHFAPGTALEVGDAAATVVLGFAGAPGA